MIFLDLAMCVETKSILSEDDGFRQEYNNVLFTLDRKGLVWKSCKLRACKKMDCQSLIEKGNYCVQSVHGEDGEDGCWTKQRLGW